MNGLAINIEYLLLTRNCVIVPGLGAFTTRTFASQWLEEEEIFLPPVRHIRFNADVFQDPDEVFLRSLSEIYGLSAEEAVNRCESMVAEFHKSLVTEGTVDFGSIGLFTLEDDAEITMSPYECGVTSPGYYGLDTLHFPLLANLPEEVSQDGEQMHDCKMENDETRATEAEIHHDEDRSPAEEDGCRPRSIVLPKGRTYVADSKHIVIRLNRAMVHYTMVAAASVLLFFLLSPNIMERDAAQGVQEATTNAIIRTPAKPVSGTNTAQVAPASVDTAETEDVLSLTQPELAGQSAANNQDVAVTSVEVVPEVEAVSEVIATPAEPAALTVETDTQVFHELQGTHCIVLASAISMKNAKAFVEKLSKKDIHAIIFEDGKMIRVVIDGFVSQADAYNVNNYLHNLDAGFKSTWVMKNQ